MKSSHVAVVFVLGCTIGALVHAAIETQRASQVNHQLLTESLAGCQDKQLSVTLLESPPGSIGLHFHPGETFTYVLDGKLTHEVRGQNLTTLETGSFVHDDNREVHQTNYLTPVKLLIVRILDKGQPETTRLQ
jgi:quercetin dioxygenase-like cupin family protein